MGRYQRIQWPFALREYLILLMQLRRALISNSDYIINLCKQASMQFLAHVVQPAFFHLNDVQSYFDKRLIDSLGNQNKQMREFFSKTRWQWRVAKVDVTQNFLIVLQNNENFQRPLYQGLWRNVLHYHVQCDPLAVNRFVLVR